MTPINPCSNITNPFRRDFFIRKVVLPRDLENRAFKNKGFYPISSVIIEKKYDIKILFDFSKLHENYGKCPSQFFCDSYNCKERHEARMVGITTKL